MATEDVRRVPRAERETAKTSRTPYSIWGGAEQFRSDDDLSPEVYTRMYRTSGHCQQAMRFTTNNILSLIGDYEHDDEEIASTVRSALSRMVSPWRSVMLAGLDGIWWGFEVMEKVIRSVQIEGRTLWGYERIKPTPQESWYPKGLVTNKFGRLVDLIQWKDVQGMEARLELERAVHWAYQGRGSVWGWGAARTAHPWYQVRRDVLELWMIGLERLSSGIIVDREHKGMAKNELGEEVSNVEKAADLWEKTTTGSALIREAVTDQHGNVFPMIDFLTGSGWQGEFKDTMDYGAREIYIAVGVPPLLQMEPEHASRAQTASVKDLTQIMLMPIAEEYADAVLVEQIVRPMIEWNWGEQENYGKFPVALPMDQAEMSKIMGDLKAAGFVVPMNQAHYESVQKLFPEILPTYDEHEKAGGFISGAPQLPGLDENPIRGIV